MKKRKGFISVLLIIVACVCALCVIRFLLAWAVAFMFDIPTQSNPLDDPPVGYETQYYNIDPTTILADIKNGKTDIFPILPENAPVLRHPSGSFNWSSVDYFEIAKAHHLFLTGEPASGEWKLFAPGHFGIDHCSDDMQGFDSATIIFYKREPEAFPVTYIEIYPLREFIVSANVTYGRMSDDTLFEKIFNNPDTSFQEALSVGSTINAEKALQIAEEAGGAELRQKFSNNCNVRITYSTDDWVVWYYQSGTKLLTVDIDAKDGTYKIK